MSEITAAHQDQDGEMIVSIEGENLGEAVVTIVHGGEETTRAAVLDQAGAVTAVVLVPADWEQQDPASRYQPDGEVVLLDDDEAPELGAYWHADRGWVAPDPDPSPEPEPVPLTGEAALRRDVDAVLGLLLTAQSGGPVPDVDWRAILAGMVQRGTAGEHELRGAHGWGLLEADDVEALLAAAQPPADPGA